MTRKLPPKSDEVEPLMQSVLNAWQPTELEGAALDALVAAALAASPADDSELEAPACDAELLAAARLASLLDGATEEDTSGAEGHLALALRAAWQPEPLPRPTLDASVDRALFTARRGQVRARWWIAAGSVAAAAAVLLAVGQQRRQRAEAPVAELRLVSPQSTQSLVAQDFSHTTATERIDRIAEARQRDLRENNFRRWGQP